MIEILRAGDAMGMPAARSPDRKRLRRTVPGLAAGFIVLPFWPSECDRRRPPHKTAAAALRARKLFIPYSLRSLKTFRPRSCVLSS